MGISHSTVRAIALGMLGVLLELLLFLPDSPAGKYLEQFFGVSATFVIELILALIGFVLMGYCIYALSLGVVKWQHSLFAEILGEKYVQLGEAVKLHALFKRQLQQGLFTCKVFSPKGAILPDTGKDHVWWGAKRTFHYRGEPREENLVGHLSGDGPFDLTWDGDKIPLNYPVGNYVGYVRVYDLAISRRNPVKEQKVTFSVARRTGWSIQTALERLVHKSDC
jgi:hypothetical protein